MRTALVKCFAGAVFLSLFAVTAADDAERLYGLARQGDSVAQFTLGNEYFFGRNRQRNPVLAVYWFRKAADGGNRQAQYNLGRCYERGWGCQRSLAMAVKYYRMAMEQDLTAATLSYAELLYAGFDAEKNVYGEFPALKADKEQALTIMRREAAKFPYGKFILAKYLPRCAAPRKGAAQNAGGVCRFSAAASGSVAVVRLMLAHRYRR